MALAPFFVFVAPHGESAGRRVGVAVGEGMVLLFSVQFSPDVIAHNLVACFLGLSCNNLFVAYALCFPLHSTHLFVECSSWFSSVLWYCMSLVCALSSHLFLTSFFSFRELHRPQSQHQSLFLLFSTSTYVVLMPQFISRDGSSRVSLSIVDFSNRVCSTIKLIALYT